MDVAQPIDRRRFLAATAGLGAAWAAGTLAGCGSPNTATASSSPPPPPFAVEQNTFDFIATTNQRVAVALATNAGVPIIPTEPVQIQIGPLGGALGPLQPTVVHSDGLANPYMLAYHRFETQGTYTIRVFYKGAHADLPITVILPSATQIPLAGKPLISIPTATLTNHRKINPICTAQPPCPFHAVSLDTAMAQHHRIALIFATPALCQSRFCGPVLDNLVAVHGPFADRVTFIHSEIYTDLTGQQSTPPVIAYHLEHEPMLLLAGPDGVVRERIDNAVRPSRSDGRAQPPGLGLGQTVKTGVS